MKSASQPLANMERKDVTRNPSATVRLISAMGGALRRSWWIAVLVVIVVGAVSFARFIREPVTYLTSQTLYIVVTPTGVTTM
jgi:uncharacterized protein involved in exopolysaccharide biosynthesis